MTPTWFNTPARLESLELVANGWIGTPFRENSAARGPGGGVSCHNLVGEVYFETGALERFDLPKGRARALVNRAALELITKFDAATSERMAVIAPGAERPLPGDTLILCDVRGLRHFGVAVAGNQFLHVAGPLGVIRSMVADSTYTVQAIRRPQP